MKIRTLELTIKETEVAEPVAFYGKRLLQPSSVASIATEIIGNSAQEIVLAIFSDVKGDCVGVFEVSRGGFDRSTVDFRVLFTAALKLQTSSIFLAHNHPSGNINPSNEDRDITSKIKKACELLGFEFRDHIIVSGEDYFSFRQEGLL